MWKLYTCMIKFMITDACLTVYVQHQQLMYTARTSHITILHAWLTTTFIYSYIVTLIHLKTAILKTASYTCNLYGCIHTVETRQCNGVGTYLNKG